MNNYKHLTDNIHYGKGLHVLCDGGGTPKYDCYFSFKILGSPFWLKRMAIDETSVPKPIVWKQTNNSAELASVYYSLLFIKRIYGPVPVVLFHDSQFAISLTTGTKSTEKPWLLTWKQEIQKIWWPSIWHTWIPGNVMKYRHYLNH